MSSSSPATMSPCVDGGARCSRRSSQRSRQPLSASISSALVPAAHAAPLSTLCACNASKRSACSGPRAADHAASPPPSSCAATSSHAVAPTAPSSVEAMAHAMPARVAGATGLTRHASRSYASSRLGLRVPADASAPAMAANSPGESDEAHATAAVCSASNRSALSKSLTPASTLASCVASSASLAGASAPICEARASAAMGNHDGGAPAGGCSASLGAGCGELLRPMLSLVPTSCARVPVCTRRETARDPRASTTLTATPAASASPPGRALTAFVALMAMSSMLLAVDSSTIWPRRASTSFAMPPASTPCAGNAVAIAASSGRPTWASSTTPSPPAWRSARRASETMSGTSGYACSSLAISLGPHSERPCRTWRRTTGDPRAATRPRIAGCAKRWSMETSSAILNSPRLRLRQSSSSFVPNTQRT
mmetsp:Transcript_39254/g.110949  ORF Transcript_39254/g.110949 Transcript_39254/m.110949 type:complete len:426 (+) Transcript_39254:1633-2910(+)